MASDRTSNATRQLGLAGTVFIALGLLSWTGATLNPASQSAVGPITMSFHSPADVLAPGDTREAILDLPEGANAPTHDVRMTARVRNASLLTSDRVLGLHVEIDECQDGWSNIVAARHAAYACDRSPIIVLTARPILMEGAPLADGPRRGTRYLRIRLRLPPEADNRFQGLRTAITYTFSGRP
jgi:hypothetical protein